MQEKTISQSAVELRIATRRACMCERAGDKNKNTLSLESKILFLIMNRPLSPADIMDALQIQKTNLATLSKRMEKNGLLIKRKSAGKREITYEITASGLAVINSKLAIIENSFRKFLISDEEYAAAADVLDNALRLLSFLSD